MHDASVVKQLSTLCLAFTTCYTSHSLCVSWRIKQIPKLNLLIKMMAFNILIHYLSALFFSVTAWMQKKVFNF